MGSLAYRDTDQLGTEAFHEWPRTVDQASGNRDVPAPVRTGRHASDVVADLPRAIVEWVTSHDIDLLRVSLGLVFLGFGLLKFFPGMSPAEPLVQRTLTTLSHGAVTGSAAMVVTAVTECFIGISLVTGRLLRAGLAVLAGALLGILSPLVLFAGDLFPGAPTLEAQYVLKDVVLVAGALVVATRSLGHHQPAPAE